uniref:Large ribosomal subunit protein uL2m n=1 Tax=Thalassiosira pseudonana TaxID=35128 RepID=Q3S288_THAPS|nr:ribosomal protein L2 [Thalassiosira pseudonana]AAZ99416.1 ribosomal protein L2 [Thalassiosira pseudonana]QWM92936.1 ribosomal protein L2 [Thalassiosira pseudonana]
MKNKFTSLTQKTLINLSKKKLNKIPLIKKMIQGQKNKAGKNDSGKITVYHKGGGHKKKYRKINFLRNEDSIGIITSLEYDPYRTAFIASVYDFLNSDYFYIVAPKNLTIGDIVKSGFNAEIKVGHSLTLMKIPVGSFIHNISLKNNKKAQLSRSAGTSSQLIEKTSKYCRIVLSSGEHKFLSSTCHATIGTVSNEFSFFKKINKAGRNRWLNVRPTVRGVAMNPIDHPHGGGEGKSSGGRSSVTPWGKPTKNGKTRKKRSKFLKS